MFIKVYIIKAVKLIINNPIYEAICSHIRKIFTSNFPNLFSFSSDLLSVFKKHSENLFDWFRYYIYSIIILYGLSWLIITMSLFLQWDILFVISQQTFKIYQIWTYPVSNFRFLFKYFYTIPFNIIFWLFETIWKICGDLFTPKKPGECSGKWEEE